MKLLDFCDEILLEFALYLWHSGNIAALCALRLSCRKLYDLSQDRSIRVFNFGKIVKYGQVSSRINPLTFMCWSPRVRHMGDDAMRTYSYNNRGNDEYLRIYYDTVHERAKLGTFPTGFAKGCTVYRSDFTVAHMSHNFHRPFDRTGPPVKLSVITLGFQDGIGFHISIKYVHGVKTSGNRRRTYKWVQSSRDTAYWMPSSTRVSVYSRGRFAPIANLVIICQKYFSDEYARLNSLVEQYNTSAHDPYSTGNDELVVIDDLKLVPIKEGWDHRENVSRVISSLRQRFTLGRRIKINDAWYELEDDHFSNTQCADYVMNPLVTDHSSVNYC
jgi:hypothetical protein